MKPFYKILVNSRIGLCDSTADQDRNDQGNDPLENELGGRGKCAGCRFFRPDENRWWRQDSTLTSAGNGADICRPLYVSTK